MYLCLTCDNVQLEFVTVYRLPIRQLVAYKPSQKLIVSSIPVGSTFFVKKKRKKKKKEEASPQGKNRAMWGCLLYTSPSPRDKRQSRMPSSA